MPKIYAARLIGTLALCGAVTLAQADTVLLVNGDKLSGKVLKKEGDLLTISTAYAGEIKLKWSEVAHIETDQPVHVILADASSLNGTLLPTESGKARLKAGEIIETAPFDLASLSYINPPPEVSGQGVKLTGRVNIGIASTSGNSKTKNVHLDSEWVARTRENRFTVGAVFNRAEDANQKTASNGRGYLKYDHFLNRHWYAYTNASGEHDRFKDLALRTTFGAGSGYQIYDSPELSLSVEGGLNYINNDYDLQDDSAYAAARWAVKYEQLLFAGLSVFHEHEGLVGLEDQNDMLIRSKTGLRFPLSQSLVGTAQLVEDWDRSPPPGKSSTDQTVLLNIGYQW